MYLHSELHQLNILLIILFHFRFLTAAFKNLYSIESCKEYQPLLNNDQGSFLDVKY